MSSDAEQSPATAGSAASGDGPDGANLTPELKFRLLQQVAQQGYDTLDLDLLVNHLLDTVALFVPYDAAGIFVLNREFGDPAYAQPRQVIASVARRGFDELPLETDPMLTGGKGIIGHVIDSGEAVLTADVRRDPHYVAGRKATQAEIAVPISIRGQVIGALNLESDRLGAFDDNDLDILRFFAGAAAISIEKVMLHRQILEKQRLEEQLGIAQEVQSRLLPDAAPQLPDYDIAGICIPTYEIGGDAFDYIPLPDGRLGVFVADVSGKGVAAALIMFAFRALLRARLREQPDLDQLAAYLNRNLIDSTARLDFITCLCGVLEPDTGRFVYVNCGHNPALLLRDSGTTVQLSNGNLVLGLFSDGDYQPDEIRFEPGDRLLLYTDGVVECQDGAGVPFGVEGLISVAAGAPAASSRQLLSHIVDQAREFCGRQQFEDDFTLVVIGHR